MAWGISLGSTFAAPDVAETRATLAKWVEARQMIAKLKADWADDQETLKSTIALFGGQLKRLEEKLKSAAESNAQVVKETGENDAKLKKYMAALDKLEELVAGYEVRLKQQVANYPPPLREQEFVSKLVTLLPEDPADTKVPLISRYQNIILILKAVQEFNSELHLVTEIRKHGEKEVQVKSLYLGLGQAWFVDQTGGFSGKGGPSAAGWAWDEDPTIAPLVQQAIAVYEKESPAAYVALPVEVK